MKRSDSPLAANRWNALVDKIVDRYTEMRDLVVHEAMSAGYPPFTEPTTPRDQYDILVAWRNAGDPRYWNDQQAQLALAKLVTQFGPPQNAIGPGAPLTPPQPVRFDLPTPQIPIGMAT